MDSPIFTHATMWVWAALADAKRPLTVQGLARVLGWRVSTVTALLERLRAAGFAHEDEYEHGHWKPGPGDPLETLTIYGGDR